MSTSFSFLVVSSATLCFICYQAQSCLGSLGTYSSLSTDLALEHPGLGASLGSLLPFTSSQRPSLTARSQAPLF